MARVRHDCSDKKQLSFKLPNGENGTLPMWQQRMRFKTPPSSSEFTGYRLNVRDRSEIHETGK